MRSIFGKEPEKLRDRYGRDTVGQSALLARRLVEAGARFVTAAGYHSNSWDTHAKNDEGHRDRLALRSIAPCPCCLMI